MKHIVIIRFSAITETVIAAPLIRAYALENPDVRFTMVSLPLLETLFDGIPNLFYCPVIVTEEQEKKFSVKIVISLLRIIARLHPSAIADFSNTPLSRTMCSISLLNGVKISAVKNPLSFSKLNEHILKRFESVLVSLNLTNLHYSDRPPFALHQSIYIYHRIGIAPFAKYEGKTWPINYMEEVVAALSHNPYNKIFLFGDKNVEAKILQSWEFKYDNCESTAGKYVLKEEMDLIRSLDLMVSMDSANMHFASYVQTPVISIWGATHPSLGFYGCGQDPDLSIGVNISCRPCSLFGKEKCTRGDYACLNNITPEMVLDKISHFFKKNETGD